MRELIWDNTLSVDVAEIDEDHQKLVALFNQLNAAIDNGAARAYIEALLEELIRFTAWHFSHEERLMVLHGYPGMAEHKAEHRQLLESAGKLQLRFNQAGQVLSSAEIEFLESWLTGHILGTDMELGTWLARVI